MVPLWGSWEAVSGGQVKQCNNKRYKIQFNKVYKANYWQWSWKSQKRIKFNQDSRHVYTIKASGRDPRSADDHWQPKAGVWKSIWGFWESRSSTGSRDTTGATMGTWSLEYGFTTTMMMNFVVQAMDWINYSSCLEWTMSTWRSKKKKQDVDDRCFGDLLIQRSSCRELYQ